MSIRAIPLLVFAFILYNVLVLAFGAEGLDTGIVSVHLLSGGDWTFRWEDLILLITLILLLSKSLNRRLHLHRP